MARTAEQILREQVSGMMFTQAQLLAEIERLNEVIAANGLTTSPTPPGAPAGTATVPPRPQVVQGGRN